MVLSPSPARADAFAGDSNRGGSDERLAPCELERVVGHLLVDSPL